MSPNPDSKFVTIECPGCKGKGSVERIGRQMTCAFCNGKGEISGWLKP